MAIDRKKLAAWYDLTAPLYRILRDDYDNGLVRRTAALLGEREGLRVLDAGCGTGLFTLGLGRCRPTWQIRGFDASPGMLAVAARQARKLSLAQVSLLRGDVDALPFADQSFDAVVAGGLFANLEDPLPALEQFRRVLRTNGKLVVVEYDRSTMSSFTRRFFRLRILGYRLIALLVPRLRFSDAWSLEASTIEPSTFQERLGAAGFEPNPVENVEEHMVFSASPRTA